VPNSLDVASGHRGHVEVEQPHRIDRSLFSEHDVVNGSWTSEACLEA